jgi:hypothetical protein
VAAGHTLAIRRSVFALGSDPLGLTVSGDNLKIESTTLATSVDLGGPGFADIAVDTTEIRIPFDGNAARLELGPLHGKFTSPGESLTLTVNGTALPPIDVGTAASCRALAGLIAAASAEITVRIAYTVALERSLYAVNGSLFELHNSAGLALSGFLRDRTLYTSKTAGHLSDHVGFAATDLTLSARDNGQPLKILTSTVDTVAGKKRWTLEVRTGFDMTVSVTPTADPLGFTNPAGDMRHLVSAELTVPLRLDFNAIDYTVTVRHAGLAVDAAIGRMQLSAGPAIARATGDRTLLSIPDSPLLTVTIIEPLSTSPTDEREWTFSVDLSNAVTIDDVANRITTDAPMVNAWVVQKGALRLLHIETTGCGSGWKLRLGNTVLLYAIGYDQRNLDFATDRIEVTGNGTVRNAAEVNESELSAMINDMINSVTGVSDNPDPAAIDPKTVFARRDGDDIVCSSLAGPVTLETRPPELLTALQATTAGGDVRLAGPTFTLDTGDILIRVGEKVMGVIHSDALRATLRGSNPLPSDAAGEAVLIALLKTPHFVVFASESGTASLTIPDAIATMDDAIEYYAANAPACSISKDSTGHFVVSSRMRGSSSSVRVRFNSFFDLASYPADDILGFTHADMGGGASAASWVKNAVGSGLFDNIESVPINTLLSQINISTDHGASIQSFYDAEVSSTGGTQSIILRGRGSDVELRQTTPPPDGIAFTGGWNRVVTALYPGVMDLTGELITLQAKVNGTVRNVHTLLWGHPARISTLVLPVNAAVLNGKVITLETGKKDLSSPVLTVLWDSLVNITFVTGPSSSFQEVAASIERAMQWSVRCTVTPTNLHIETTAEGSVMVLRISAPGDATSAVTGNPATGFTSAAVLPQEVTASGSVPLVDEVSAEQYRDLVRGAYIEEIANTDASIITSRSFNWSAYYSDDAIRTHLVIQSDRLGCLSSVIPIVDRTTCFGWKKQFQRSPAIFASVAFAPITTPLNISGILSIQFNNNAGGEDLPHTVITDVNFPLKTGGYNAADVAARLNEELLGRGAGQAGAYPDGTVVIESSVPGLNGSVCVPAPGTVTVSNTALVSAFLGTGTNPRNGRGWPGIPVTELTLLTPGFRSKVGPASADAVWQFTDASRTVSVPVISGDTLIVIRDKCENAFKPDAAFGRMASCQINEEDNCLYIEATGSPCTLAVQAGGRTLDVIDPSLPGQTPEREEDPACGLRLTNETRTWYFCRDRFDKGNFADMDESKWVRVTAVMRALSMPPLAAGQPGLAQQIPGGRYWTAVRADAAKTTNYDPSGEMIISGASLPVNPVDPAAGNYCIVHRARYWTMHADGQHLSLSQTPDGRFLVDIVIG